MLDGALFDIFSFVAGWSLLKPNHRNRRYTVSSGAERALVVNGTNQPDVLFETSCSFSSLPCPPATTLGGVVQTGPPKWLVANKERGLSSIAWVSFKLIHYPIYLLGSLGLCRTTCAKKQVELTGIFSSGWTCPLF